MTKADYKWRLLYKPPVNTITNDPDTWCKVFYISKYECPEPIDLEVKIRELKQLYKMRDEYVYLEDLEETRI